MYSILFLGIYLQFRDVYIIQITKKCLYPSQILVTHTNMHDYMPILSQLSLAHTTTIPELGMIDLTRDGYL